MEGGTKVITIVCTGNSCRSPMAERLLSHALRAEPAPWNTYKVISAGVAAFPGDTASRNAVAALKKVGIDLSDHRSRSLSDQVIEISDLILTMTESHLQAVKIRNPGLDIPVHRFREWMPSGSKEIPDPCGGPLDIYLETRDSLAEAIPSVITYIKQHFEA